MSREPERDQEPDDWFADLDDVPPPPRGAVPSAGAPAPAPEAEDWLDETATPIRARAAAWPTSTKLAVVAVVLVVALILGLLLGGVFDSSKTPTSPPTTQPATTTQPAATTTPSPTPAAPVPVPSEQLAFGDKGDAVSELQRALTKAGYPVTADGDYGQATKDAVKQFQADEGLPEDGIAGPKTLDALRAKLNAA